MSAFSQRLQIAIQAHGPLCVGIDPAAPTLKACGLPDSADGAFALGQRILSAGTGHLALVKPQSAYFERFGSAGWRALEDLIALARTQGRLVLLDAKRGDIDTTAEAYAHAFFSTGSPTRVDAITVNAYLGFDALKLLIDFAAAHGCGVFVVVRSSNPEGTPVQTARLPDGSTVAEHLATSITAYNRAQSAESPGPIGAVVGATLLDAGEIAARVPRSYLLAPGVGAQGASLDDIALRFGPARTRVIPSVSRAIIAQGTNESEIRTTIRALGEKAKRLLAG